MDDLIKRSDAIEAITYSHLESQTDIHDFTDCDFCKEKNCEDCEGGKTEPQTERSSE